jgi:hypothetical protein
LLGLTLSSLGAVPAAGSFPNLPLCFEALGQQTGTAPRFLARGRNYQFLLTPTSADLVLSKVLSTGEVSSLSRYDPQAQRQLRTRTVRMEFVGANPQATLRGIQEMPGKINYLLGAQPAQWQTGVPTYARAQVERLYPDIDLLYYGNQHQLEYDFTLAPGADPGAIAIRFAGADKVAVNDQGELILSLGADEIRQPQPVVYQMRNGERRRVEGGYRLVDDRTVAFAISQYDRQLPLIIDPTLSYSTYFGGSADDLAWSVKVDTNGFVYVAGQTLSTAFAFPIPPGGYQPALGGGIFNGDAFIAKFDSAGSNLVYFTYLGGSGNDAALDLAVDDAGHAYVTGYTDSTNFPTSNALFPQIAGPITSAHRFWSDAFVAELETNGSSLVFSTYLGGSGADVGIGIALDPGANTYVTGYTYSTNFPTLNPVPGQGYLHGSNDVFVTKFAPGGTNLVYSTYLGGNHFDVGQGIAADAAGFAYVTGYTASTNFPSFNGLIVSNNIPTQLNHSTNAFRVYNGRRPPYDAFVAKLGPFGSNLVYSTYLGGTQNDSGFRIQVDGAGNAYVTGSSSSPDFPNTAFPNLQSITNLSLPNSDVFLTKINTDTNGLAQIKFSALLGGPRDDVGWDLALDPLTTNVFVVGTTSSTNFPQVNTHIPFLQVTNRSRSNDVFVIAFTNTVTVFTNSDLSTVTSENPSILYSVNLGGIRDDFGYGIAVDSAGSAYLVGQTLSTDFPTSGARQPSLVGISDGFLSKILLPDLLVTVSVQTAPAGLMIQVDGTNYTAPQTFSWLYGSPHTLSVPPTQNGTPGTRYAWTSWSDAGGLSHQIFPLAGSTITAAFKSQYLLTMTPSTGGAYNPAGGWYDSGATVALTATPGIGQSFSGWLGTGSGSFSGTNNPASVTLGGPVVETATFTGPADNRLTVLVTGNGTVSPDYNGKALEVGKSYTVTAKPGADSIFSNWTGGIPTNTAKLTFIMANNLVLQANFIPNPFIPAKGNYAGLFFDTNRVAQISSGFFTATLADKGAFSAKFTLAGRPFSLSDQFSGTGSFSNSISRGPFLSRISVSLQLDLASGSRITGQISDGSFAAQLLANRLVYSRSAPAPLGGKKFILDIPGSTAVLTLPGGDGFGTISVDSLGNVSFAGTLGDGTKITQRTFVSGQGQWPFYAPLYSGNGAIFGWLTFTNEPSDDLSGAVNWFKPGRPRTRFYPGGFAFATTAIGSLYAFTSGTPLLSLTNGQVILSGGNLSGSVTNQASIDSRNKVTVSGPNRMTLSLSTGSGLFHGSFTHPITRQTVALSGAVLQKPHFGAGIFFGTNQTGRVFLGQ